MQNNADAVSKASTNLNNAKALFVRPMRRSEKPPLRHICVGIVDGKKDDLADVSFKEEADHYLNEKLTGYHDRMTRAALLEIAFFPTFYSWFSSRFFKAFLAAVNDECDTTTISGYYEDITALLGSTVELDALTQAMQNAFFSITHIWRSTGKARSTHLLELCCIKTRKASSPCSL